jgi:Glycosyltransferase family 87
MGAKGVGFTGFRTPFEDSGPATRRRSWTNMVTLIRSSTADPNLTTHCRWLRRHIYSSVATLILGSYLLSYCLSARSDWDHIYLQAARRLLAGGDLFRFADGYAYPPCKALFMVPFLALPELAQRAAWWACNVACFVLLCRWSWRLAGGGRLEGSPTPAWSEHVICLAGLATGIFYAFNSISNQGTDVPEAALLMGACLALLAGRDFLAATEFGLAAGMKATPLLWVFYLLWKGRWKPAIWLVVVAIGVNLLPDLVSTCPSGSSWLLAWHQQYLAPMQRPDYAPGAWGSTIHLNQSLAGAVNRLFIADWTWTADGLAIHRRANPMDAHTLKLALLASEALLVACCALLWGRRSEPRPLGSGTLDGPLPDGRGSDKTASLPASLEYSMVLLLMLLLSPMSSKAHFCTLLLPGFAVARAAWQLRSVSIAIWFVAANLIGLLALSWFGKFTAQVSLYYGAVSIKALLLLIACGGALVLLRRRERQTICASPAESVGTVRAAAESAVFCIIQLPFLNLQLPSHQPTLPWAWVDPLGSFTFGLAPCAS